MESQLRYPRVRRLASQLTGCLSVAVAALFGAGYLARWVGAEAAWPIQIAALVLPATSVAVVVGAAGWTIRWILVRTHAARMLGVLLALLSLLAAARYAPSPVHRLMPVDREEEPESVLRIVSVNAGGSHRVAPTAGLDVARTVRPHLIGLQEAEAHSIGTGDERRVAGQRAVLGFLASGGYTAVVENHVRLGLLRAPDVSASPPREILIAEETDSKASVATRHEVEWGDVTFAVYVVHLRSYSQRDRGWVRALRAFRRDLALRIREAEALRDVLNRERLPFLVLGDLNATPDQRPYWVLAQGLQDGLSDQEGWTPTFPDKMPLVQIDVILASPHWHVSKAGRLPPGLSDHRGIFAFLALRSDGTS